MYKRTITGSAYWASYIINGDASGIDAAELAAANEWLRIELQPANGETIVSCEEEARLSWSYDIYTHTDTRGGELLDYVVIGWTRRERKAQRKLAPRPIRYSGRADMAHNQNVAAAVIAHSQTWMAGHETAKRLCRDKLALAAVQRVGAALTGFTLP